MKRILSAAAAAVVLSLSPLPASAAAIKSGFLVCQVQGGDGFVFGSTKSLACTYTPLNSAQSPESYTGIISRFGVDIGFTRDGLLKWAVLAKKADSYAEGALGGSYFGAGSEVTVALGLGSNILVSKTSSNWVLQPVSISGQTGLNIAFGIAELDLVPATK